MAPTDLAGWIADRRPAGVDLDPDGCADLATALFQNQAFWQSLLTYSPGERFCHQLYRDPNLDVWLLCWADGQGTGYHDHDRSSGGVCVVQGTVAEDYFARGADGAIREATRHHEVGQTFRFDNTYIHNVRHAGQGMFSASIHVYSPALWRMGWYLPDDNGVLRRVITTYADDLLAS